MQHMQRTLWLAVSCSLLVIPPSGDVLARQTSVTAGASSGFDFRDRTYDNSSYNNDNDDIQKISIGPTIAVVSKGIHDTFNLSYAPKLGYDFQDNDTSSNHNFSVSNERFLSKKWTLTLSDNYLYSDDPDEADSVIAATTTGSGQLQGTPSSTLSRDLSGRRYWMNTATVRTDYALAEKTSVGGGYIYTVLRNSGEDTQDNDEDYDKHYIFTNLSHGFNQNWRSNLGLNYTRGLYDSEEVVFGQPSSTGTPDLDQYGGEIGVDYVQSVRDFYPFKYSGSETDYDGDTRRDSQIHQWSAGWNHAFDPRTSLALGGGPSYAKIQGLDGTWGYNAYLQLNRKYQHASWALQLDKLYETDNFNGTDESGLTDTYNARANWSYQHTQSLGFDLYGRASWQSYYNPQGQYLTASTGTFAGKTGDISYDTTEYEAGVGLRYTFARWYTAGIKYSYFVSDGDLSSDQYTDHRVMFTLSAAKEMWRW